MEPLFAVLVELGGSATIARRGVIERLRTVGALSQEVFESYRNELRSVRVIGFDELLKRINNILALFDTSFQ